MSELQTVATFESDMPADGSPPGFAIAQLISAMLARQGLTVSRPEASADGWEIATKQEAARMLFLLKRADTWLLIAEDRTGRFARMLGRRRPKFSDVLERLGAEMAKVVRFRDLRWLTRAEFEAGGGAARTG